MEEQNNKFTICGEIATNPVFSHDVFGEGFYEMFISCKRSSGTADVLPITISERLMNEYDFRAGATLNAVGQFRSYNKLIDKKSRLILTLFVTEVLENENTAHSNAIILQGYICKEPIYRTTPFDREITDILLAVNRSYSKSDYIPCIAWGRNANYAQNFNVGDKIAIVGRIQSREYNKKISGQEVKKMVAYEVSISKLFYGDKVNQTENEIV
jgi:primosomal replication protein N